MQTNEQSCTCIYSVTGETSFETRSQINSVVRSGKLRLAELITKLSEFERNVYWRMGWRLKCHTGRHGPQGHKTLRVLRYCLVYGPIVARRNVATLAEG